MSDQNSPNDNFDLLNMIQILEPIFEQMNETLADMPADPFVDAYRKFTLAATAAVKEFKSDIIAVSVDEFIDQAL